MPFDTTRRTRFTDADLDRFAIASHDRNPLHLDASYAHRSPFGTRVVYGVLGALSMLGELPATGARLSRLVLEFPRPMFTDVDYSIHVAETDADASGSRYSLRLSDGELLLTRGAATLARELPTSSAPRSEAPAISAAAWPERARVMSEDELVAGFALELPFDVTPEHVGEIDDRLGLAARGVRSAAQKAIIATSYVIGMHVPGERALFSRLELNFFDVKDEATPVTLHVSLRKFDARLGVVRLAVRFDAAAETIAQGELQAFVRRSFAGLPVASAVDVAQDFAGQVALVIGGSRGLGAALALDLARRGANVLATYKSSEPEARRLATSAETFLGSLEMVRGDSASAAFCSALRGDIEARFGRLDLLFCNASPAIHPLYIDADSSERLMAHVDQHLRLVAMPLAHFVTLVAKSRGAAILTSTIATETIVADWPHYIAAKAAAEALFRVAAREHAGASFVIARPPQLLTDFAPILGATSSALPPERVVGVVLATLAKRVTTASPNVTTLDRFGD